MRNNILFLSLIIGMSIVMGVPRAVDAGLSPTHAGIDDVRFEQKINQKLFDRKKSGKEGEETPADDLLKDENGIPVQIDQLVGNRPVILSFLYFKCPNLCSLVLNGVVDAVKSSGLEPGRDVDLLSVSINPEEKSELALAKKRTYLARLGLYGDDNPVWHFLTGSQESIKKVTELAGFHYQYDPISKEFAHPSGFLVLTPSGKISRYFSGIRFSPGELKAAILDAREERAKKTLLDVVLNCFHYNPETGKYGKLIGLVLQGAGLLTVAGLGALFVVLRFRPRLGFSKKKAAT
jgi:protein SCO1/2